MKQSELTTAISTGIFLAIIGVMTLIFVLWLFSPLLIPLALDVQSFAVLHPREILAYLVFLAALVYVGFMIYSLVQLLIWLVDRFFEWRIKVRKSRLTNLKKDPS